MNTRYEYQSRTEPSRSSSSEDDSTIGSAIGSMMKAPFWMTAAGLNWMTSGMERVGQSMSGSSTSSISSSASGSAGNGSRTSSSSGDSSDRGSWPDWANPSNWGSGSTGSSASRPWNDQDLSGDDLKYVTWSIVFTKRGYEAVLSPMQNELVGYSTDQSSYAAMKIAKFVERARFGQAEKPHGWVERDYPSDSLAAAQRAEGTKESGTKAEGSKTDSSKDKRDSGWRIPSEDQKFVQFLYRVEWRLPKREETTHVERVTVERTANAHAKITV